MSFWLLNEVLENEFPGFLSTPVRLLGFSNTTAKVALSIGLIALSAGIFVHLFTGKRRSPPVSGSRIDFEVILESLFESALVLTNQGRIHMVNQSAAAAFGMSRKAMRGLKISDLILSANVGDAEQSIDTGSLLEMQHCHSSTPIIATVLGANDRTFTAKVRFRMITGFGETQYVLLMRELDDPVKSAVTAGHSQSNYRNLLDNLLDGVYRFRADGTILAANAALVRILGYSSETELCASVNARSLYRYPEKRREIDNLLEAESVVRNRKIELLRKDGTSVSVLANLRALVREIESDAAYEGIFCDISHLVGKTGSGAGR